MPRAPSDLVGRRSEVAILDAVLGRVEQGLPGALGVSGEPGIGKSRLLRELADRAGDRGMLVLAGRGAELERDLPFAVLVDALDEPAAEHADAVSGLDPALLADLVAVLPALGRAVGVTPTGDHGERHRIARAIRALLEHLARERPVALLLDDVHWADPASADALALLLHRLPAAPVLLAVATRTGRAVGLETALAQAARHGTAQLIELGPLDADTAQALMPGVGRLDRARLFEESGGNPFYLEELARTHGAHPPRAPVQGLLGVPGTVRAALTGELAVLEADTRVVLEGAAVAGDPFELDQAAAAAGVSEPTALAALDELLEAELVRPTADARRFRFRHPLVRRAVYEAAGGGWRLAAHLRAANWLAARGAAPAQRAHHAERAGRLGDLDAIAVLTQAAQETVAAAPGTAAVWLEAALRLLPDDPEHAGRRLELMGLLGGALASAGRAADARDVLRRVLAALPPEAADERVAVVIGLTHLAAVWSDRPDEARRLLAAERTALGSSRPDLVAALTLAMAHERTGFGDRAAAEALAEQARRAARAAGNAALEADAAVLAAEEASAALRRDDPELLAAVDGKLARAEGLVGALDDAAIASRMQVLLWLAVAHVSTGGLEACAAVADRGLALARASRQGAVAPSFLAVRGAAHEALGRLDAAEADAEEALESAIVSGNEQLASFNSGVLSWVALSRGHVERALVHGQAMWDHMPTIPYNAAGCTIADARLAVGDAAGALEALNAYGWVDPAMWPLDRARGVEVAVRVLLALGRVEEAVRWARRAPAEAGGRRKGIFGALVGLAEAHVLLARGEPEAAAAAALAGAAEASWGHAAVWAIRCRILGGEALAAAGHRDRARAELALAVSEGEALGALGHRESGMRALRRLGARPRAAPAIGAGGLAGLTPREQEIAVLVGEGRTNAQIAARLKLSERTVEKHVSNVLAKLGVPSRSAVVRLLATSAGPVPSPAIHG